MFLKTVLTARSIILPFFILFSGLLPGQVAIPEVYRGKFPYYIGHTKYEINGLAAHNHHRSLIIDPSRLDTSGQADASAVIQSYLDSAVMFTGPDTFCTVELPAGRIRIEHEL